MGNLNDFKEEKWSDLKLRERQEMLQKIENQMANESRRTARKVSVKKLPEGSRGSYDFNKPIEIKISKEMLKKSTDGYQCMATVIHEGRHAYQDDVVSGHIPPQESDRDNVASWRANSPKVGGVYNESGDSRIDYLFQPKEIDANNFARQKMNSFKEYFKNDPKYQEYSDNRDMKELFMHRRAHNEYGENYREKIANDIERRYKANIQGKQGQSQQSKQARSEGQAKDSPAMQRYKEQQGQIAERVKAYKEAQSESQDIVQGRGVGG